MKRLIAIADLHCGHYGGLTPPKYQIRQPRRPNLYALQKQGWNMFKKMKDEAIDCKHPRALVLNGDVIDGNRFPNELIESDRSKQCEMAEEIIKGFKVSKIIMTRGTPSHVGKEEDWEDSIAKDMGADIRAEQFVNVDGVRFYFRHKIGRSSIPYGKHTAPTRMAIWNALKSAWKLEPSVDWLVFDHVHYCSYSGNFFGEKEVIAVTSPSLQTVSQYGIKECEGLTHFGLMWWDIHDGKVVDWQKRIKIIQAAKPREIKL